MIQVTNENIRAFYYDKTRDDYFFKDNDERVPDSQRKGFYTTIFRTSSSRRVDLETPEETAQREKRRAEARAAFKKRIGRS